MHTYELQSQRTPPGEAPPCGAEPDAEERFEPVQAGPERHTKLWLEEGQYVFRVRARNNAGYGAWCEPATQSVRGRLATEAACVET